MSNFVYNVSVARGEYQDADGNKKTNWHPIGRAVPSKTKEGSFILHLDSFPVSNPETNLPERLFIFRNEGKKNG